MQKEGNSGTEGVGFTGGAGGLVTAPAGSAPASLPPVNPPMAGMADILVREVVGTGDTGGGGAVARIPGCSCGAGGGPAGRTGGIRPKKRTVIRTAAMKIMKTRAMILKFCIPVFSVRYLPIGLIKILNCSRFTGHCPRRDRPGYV